MRVPRTMEHAAAERPRMISETESTGQMDRPCIALRKIDSQGRKNLDPASDDSFVDCNGLGKTPAANRSAGCSLDRPSFSRPWLHRTSPLSGVHNFDRVYAVSLSLMAGRGFNDLAVDASPACAPLREFFELRRTHISREELATYLASEPDSTRDSKYQWYLPLATT